MSARLDVDGDRLERLLAEVNLFGALPAGGVERLAWTEPEVDARAWLLERCGREGLEAEQDEAGNIWAWGGARPAVVMGSHLDTVPNGGSFDGALGVMAALEVLTSARSARIPNAERLAMVCFADEEGVRFSTGMTGSRAVAGTLDAVELQDAATPAGERLWDVLSEHGLDPARVLDARDRRSAIGTYLELHVEQGRRLESEDSAVGLVTSIAGLSSWHIHVHGQANHAGTTQLADRRDALLPVAAGILAARQVMQALPGLAATVGDARVVDGAGNIVPGHAQCSLDVRSTDRDDIETAVRRILDAIESSAADHGCHVSAEQAKAMAPITLDDGVLAATRMTAGTGQRLPELASMAGHDAMALAAAGVPSGMIFVRSRGGLSHCPEEHSSVSDSALGAQHLADAALLLARELPAGH